MTVVKHLMANQYDINIHVHRLAAWAAATAASSAKGKRFSVAAGVTLIEAAGLHRLVGSPGNLPEPSQMDAAHCTWREAVIGAASRAGLNFFTHGLAAKLINVYLKVVFVNTAYASDLRVAALHPPVDRELLKGLAKSGRGAPRTWRTLRDAAWSKFDSDTYQEAIDAIRAALLPGQPLWAIEEHWQGYQGQGPSNTTTEDHDDQD